MKEVAVIIPSFRPPTEIHFLCENLKKNNIHNILVVNDGSPKDYDPVFHKLEVAGVDVLTSKENRGKGYAIKIGIAQAQLNYPDCTHFVFCDDDGQHAIGDVIRVAQKAVIENLTFVLGQRSFADNTPWKSLLGNRFTSTVLKLRYNIDAPDSQSGLRCISRNLCTLLLNIPENRFGFELKAIINLHESGIKLTSVPIETIYFEGNSRTRFRPIRDSLGVIQIALGLR
jgi:glycosyltransferase involved in cell wall biosynthesis